MHTRLRSTAMLLVTLVISNAALAATPTVFWASGPVGPDETVMLQGSDFGAKPVVEIIRWVWNADVHKSEVVKPTVIQGRDDSLKFTIPAEWKLGVYECRVLSDDAASEPLLLNVPDPWWMQGDSGSTATPGGYFRVMGKSLAYSLHASALLKRVGSNDDEKSTHLTAADSDGYSLRFDLPADLTPGEYSVRVHNWLGGAGRWMTAGTLRVEAPVRWPLTVFSVTEFYGEKAAAEMRKTLVKYQPVPDRTEGIRAALKKAKDNGGGVVYFPAGRYGVQGELNVPPRTVLRGEGEGLVVLWWGSGRFNMDGGATDKGREKDTESKTPGTLISGSQYGIEQMSLYFPLDYRTGITADERFWMRHVRVRIDKYWTANGGRQNCQAIRAGQNFEITDCDILARGDGIVPGSCGIIARNRITAGKSNIPMGGAQNLIVEDNQFIATDPTAYINISGMGRNIYYARNKHEAAMTHQSDFSFTFDSGPGAYFGKLTAEGTKVTLAEDPKYPEWAKETSQPWKRSVVFITTGRGAGQYRFVTSNKGKSWEIDRPFDVSPDATSLATIVPFKGRVLVINNDFEDANWVNAGYGTTIDVIVAGNKLHRCAEMLTYGLDVHDAVQPCWYVQFFDNTLLEGQTSLIAHSGSRSELGKLAGPLTRCVIMRRNTIGADNGGDVKLTGNICDVIMEGTALKYPTSVIKVDGDTSGIVLRKNVFEGGTSPRYEGGGVAKAAVMQGNPER